MEGARDVRMVEHAVRQRWPIPPDKREFILLSLLAMVGDRNLSDRARISAARTLVQMERQNQADEHRARPERHLNVNVTPEQLAGMSDDELAALERRLLGKDA